MNVGDTHTTIVDGKPGNTTFASQPHSLTHGCMALDIAPYVSVYTVQL